MEKLTGKQVRHLRALGHHLNPVVMVGREGISPALVRTAEEALSVHELIKVRVQEGCDLDRREAAASLAEETKAAVVQVLGRTFLLYRPGEQKKIELP